MEQIVSPYINYSISLSNKTHKFIEKLSKKDRELIVSKIETLKKDIQSLDIKKLKNYNNLYRIRIGNYRLVYKPVSEQKVILIVLIAHRKEVYALLKSLSTLIQ